MSDPIVIAIDGPSASGKSTNAKIIAATLGYAYVDTGAMYRTLAWHALQQSVDVTDAAAVAALCADWPAALVHREGSIWLEVERQRSCVQFGNLVMEGRDIGSNIFPETPHKFYMDAAAAVRQARRDADGVQDNLAARDQRDSTRASSPLKVAEGATIINNAGETPEQTSARIMDLVKERLGD